MNDDCKNWFYIINIHCLKMLTSFCFLIISLYCTLHRYFFFLNNSLIRAETSIFKCFQTIEICVICDVVDQIVFACGPLYCWNHAFESKIRLHAFIIQWFLNWWYFLIWQITSFQWQILWNILFSISFAVAKKNSERNRLEIFHPFHVTIMLYVGIALIRIQRFKEMKKKNKMRTKIMFLVIFFFIICTYGLLYSCFISATANRI